MPLDHDLSVALQARLSAAAPAGDLEAMRRGFAATGASLPAPDIGEVSNHIVTAGDRTVPVRLYRPAGEGPTPLLIFLHGGGFMFGDLDSHDAACRHLVVACGCAVAAVGYRLAPEHPFPAGLDDCLAACEWLLDQAEALGCHAELVALGGESAGGNLAAVVARRLAGRRGARIALQLLIHPLTDFRFQTPSITEVEAPGLSAEGMQMVRALYLGAADPNDPDASPALAIDLAGLAPAIVITVEVDPLRDEGEAYALQLAAAGVETTLVRLPGLVHGFMFETADVPIIARAYARIGELFQRTLEAAPRQAAT